jgi:hypothetical protein
MTIIQVSRTGIGSGGVLVQGIGEEGFDLLRHEKMSGSLVWSEPVSKPAVEPPEFKERLRPGSKEVK